VTNVSMFRLYLMRAAYSLLVVGLAFDQWPALLQRGSSWDLWHGVGSSLLCAICVLALVGIRYPVKMLPLLLFELTWKVIWLLVIALPRYSAHQVTPAIQETTFNCVVGIVIFPLLIPWGYVWRNYVRAPSEPWRRERHCLVP